MDCLKLPRMDAHVDCKLYSANTASSGASWAKMLSQVHAEPAGDQLTGNLQWGTLWLALRKRLQAHSLWINAVNGLLVCAGRRSCMVCMRKASTALHSQVHVGLCTTVKLAISLSSWCALVRQRLTLASAPS